MKGDIGFNRAAFLAGSLAALGTATPRRSEAAAAAPGPAPEDVLAQLMAGNRRFVNNDFPVPNRVAEKRELLKESQAPPQRFWAVPIHA